MGRRDFGCGGDGTDRCPHLRSLTGLIGVVVDRDGSAILVAAIEELGIRLRAIEAAVGSGGGRARYRGAGRTRGTRACLARVACVADIAARAAAACATSGGTAVGLACGAATRSAAAALAAIVI